MDEDRVEDEQQLVHAAKRVQFVLAFAGCWIIAEWLRSWVFTGFAWNPLGVIAIGDAAASSIEIRGARLPDAVLAFSDVEAPPRR